MGAAGVPDRDLVMSSSLGAPTLLGYASPLGDTHLIANLKEVKFPTPLDWIHVVYGEGVEVLVWDKLVRSIIPMK